MFHVKPEYEFLVRQISKYSSICQNNEDYINQSLAFIQELLDYNKKVNLISRKDIANVIVNQWLHSLLALSVVPGEGLAKILDFGSGGGFPGILMALYFPNAKFTLVESVAKKSLFLETVSVSLGLENIKVLTKRVENLSTNHRSRYDVVTARAVTNLTQLWKWSVHLLKPGGFLLTWKKYNTTEIEDLKKSIQYKLKIDVLTPENDFDLERLSETRLIKIYKK